MNDPRFFTTRWSRVAAATGDDADARAALAELCERYWYPVYAFVRRSGHEGDAAMDLTQGFFADLLERGDLAGADRTRGRFRSWLLACVKHYVANERDRQRAAKRGGGAAPLSIDETDAEGRYLREPSDDADPERRFARAFAVTLLDRVFVRLEEEQATPSARDRFAALRPLLARSDAAAPLADVAARIGATEGAIKVALHRLRRRYADLLRREIAETVDDPAAVDEEIGDLFRALATRGDDPARNAEENP